MGASCVAIVVDASPYACAEDYVGSTRLQFAEDAGALIAEHAFATGAASHCCLLHNKAVLLPAAGRSTWGQQAKARRGAPHAGAFDLLPAVRAALLATKRFAAARVVVLVSSPMQLTESACRAAAEAVAAAPGRALDVVVLGGINEQPPGALELLQSLVSRLNSSSAASAASSSSSSSSSSSEPGLRPGSGGDALAGSRPAADGRPSDGGSGAHGLTAPSRLVQYPPPEGLIPAWQCQEGLLERLELPAPPAVVPLCVLSAPGGDSASGAAVGSEHAVFQRSGRRRSFTGEGSEDGGASSTNTSTSSGEASSSSLPGLCTSEEERVEAAPAASSSAASSSGGLRVRQLAGGGLHSGGQVLRVRRLDTSSRHSYDATSIPAGPPSASASSRSRSFDYGTGPRPRNAAGTTATGTIGSVAGGPAPGVPAMALASRGRSWRIPVKTSPLAGRALRPSVCRFDSLDSLQHLSSDGLMHPWLPSYATLGRTMPGRPQLHDRFCSVSAVKVLCPPWYTLFAVPAGLVRVSSSSDSSSAQPRGGKAPLQMQPQPGLGTLALLRATDGSGAMQLVWRPPTACGGATAGPSSSGCARAGGAPAPPPHNMFEEEGSTLQVADPSEGAAAALHLPPLAVVQLVPMPASGVLLVSTGAAGSGEEGPQRLAVWLRPAPKASLAAAPLKQPPRPINSGTSPPAAAAPAQQPSVGLPPPVVAHSGLGPQQVAEQLQRLLAAPAEYSVAAPPPGEQPALSRPVLLGFIPRVLVPDLLRVEGHMVHFMEGRPVGKAVIYHRREHSAARRPGAAGAMGGARLEHGALAAGGVAVAGGQEGAGGGAAAGGRRLGMDGGAASAPRVGAALIVDLGSQPLDMSEPPQQPLASAQPAPAAPQQPLASAQSAPAAPQQPQQPEGRGEAAGGGGAGGQLGGGADCLRDMLARAQHHREAAALARRQQGSARLVTPLYGSYRAQAPAAPWESDAAVMRSHPLPDEAVLGLSPSPDTPPLRAALAAVPACSVCGAAEADVPPEMAASGTAGAFKRPGEVPAGHDEHVSAAAPVALPGLSLSSCPASADAAQLPDQLPGLSVEAAPHHAGGAHGEAAGGAPHDEHSARDAHDEHGVEPQAPLAAPSSAFVTSHAQSDAAEDGSLLFELD